MFHVLIRILVVLINIFYFKLVIIMTKLVLVHIYQCLISCYYFKIIHIISELFLSHPFSSVQPNRKMAYLIHLTKHASWISLSQYPWITVSHPTSSSNPTHPNGAIRTWMNLRLCSTGCIFWLMLICCERKTLSMAGWFWLISSNEHSLSHLLLSGVTFVLGCV
jgi:hypothetical protein